VIFIFISLLSLEESLYNF